ncbi:MAG: hypothetical protein ACOYIG_08090, partial [Acetivibrionales bacterium]
DIKNTREIFQGWNLAGVFNDNPDLFTEFELMTLKQKTVSGLLRRQKLAIEWPGLAGRGGFRHGRNFRTFAGDLSSGGAIGTLYVGADAYAAAFQ